MSGCVGGASDKCRCISIHLYLDLYLDSRCTEDGGRGTVLVYVDLFIEAKK